MGSKSSYQEMSSFDISQSCSMLTLKSEKKHDLNDLIYIHTKGSFDSLVGNGRISKYKGEREYLGKLNTNNRVVIFGDKEIDRKDPDYDRNFDRHSLRFDLGFGFNIGQYHMQAIYAPTIDYNT